MKNTVLTVMKNLYIAILLLLISSALADGAITQEYVNVVGACATNLIRVIKEVDIKFRYILYYTNVWTQMPDMAMEFYVPFDQFVRIKYKIVLFQGAYLYTRVLVDGAENTDFRDATGETNHHNNAADDEVWLTKGLHFAKVEYRTPANYLVEPTDYNGAIFKVIYFRT